MAIDTGTWRISVILTSDQHLDQFEVALEPLSGAVTMTEIGADGARGTGRWQLVAYGEAEPDRADLTSRLAVLAESLGIELPYFRVEKLPETDWVARVAADAVPISAGRFFVHGSHFDGDVPAGMVPILVDATRAFGSGTHESTRGCLFAIDKWLESRAPKTALDLGAGSGILAIAVAKSCDARIVASDNDPVCVEIAQENAELNGVADQISTVLSQGFQSRRVHRQGPFDWIIANILAEPLRQMAPAIVRQLRPNGIAILAGFVVDQADDVARAYEERGASIIDQLELNEWRTLVVSVD